MEERVELTGRPTIEDIFWATGGPRRTPGYIPIVSPKPGASIEAIILSESLVEVYVHWLNGRSVPCQSGKRICDLCHLNYGRKWKAYLGVFWPLNGRIGLLEITVNAADKCPQLREHKTLRGARIKVKRPGSAPNAAVYADLYPYHPSAGFQLKDLPPAFDCQLALMRVWYG